MNSILYLIAFTLLSGPSAPQNEIDSSADQPKVEQAVVNWANTTFKRHQDYKFEHFKAFYTDEYFIQTMRLELYAEKIAALEKKKANGEYTGSDEVFNADVQKLKGAMDKAKATIEKIDPVEYFQIHFWSNILTKDGITVYYELILKLDGNYAVTEAMENSSIGKKGVESKIAYNKGITTTLVTEK